MTALVCSISGLALVGGVSLGYNGTLSSVTARTNIGSEESEVEKILSEDYVPPTEEEYVASQPTYEEEKQIEKKKKKWWNPFD